MKREEKKEVTTSFNLYSLQLLIAVINVNSEGYLPIFHHFLTIHQNHHFPQNNLP